MSVAGDGGVFVSYRREGGSDAAGRLADRLVDRFGEERVFIDVDAIEPGMDYVEAITRAVTACDVLVAVIGPGWLTAADKRGRRLDDPNDWVRVEIGTALARGVRVIPVLVGSVDMPTREELPKDLAGLARRNALRVRHETFRTNAGQLVAVVERVLASAAPVSISDKTAAASADVPHSVVRQDSVAGTADVLHATQLLVEAQRVAGSITSGFGKVSALLDLARVVAATEPRRAVRIFEEVEHIADSITNESQKAAALCEIARATARTDLDRAERIADTITDPFYKGRALNGIVQAVVRTDLERAERIADSITDEMYKGRALNGIVQAVAKTDLERAERIADTITYQPAKASALLDIAKAHI
jgi:TIR domain